MVFGGGNRGKDSQPLSLGLKGVSHLAALGSLFPSPLPLFLERRDNHLNTQPFLVFYPSPRCNVLKIGTLSCSDMNHNLGQRRSCLMLKLLNRL